MENVLAIYQRPRDPKRPLVCLDEAAKQLVSATRLPISMMPGRIARHDYEYKREGTANLFMAFAPLEALEQSEAPAIRATLGAWHTRGPVSPTSGGTPSRTVHAALG